MCKSNNFGSLILLILTVLCCISCSTVKTSEIIPPRVKIDAITMENIIYKIISNDSLALDIYLPKIHTASPRPAVLFIHGGGWTGGDKSVIKTFYRQYVLQALLERGYVAVSINYRTINDSIHFPAPIIDCKDAVRWLHKNAGAYHIDENNIGLWGASAGGHLALMTAYSNDDDFVGDGHLKGFRADVAYVIDNFGPADLYHLLRPQLNAVLSTSLRLFAHKKYLNRKVKIEQITGLPLQNNSETTEVLKQFSPVKWIHEKGVPTLVMHGNNDELVPFKQSIILIDALKAKDVKFEFHSYEDAIHGFKNMHINDIQTTTSHIISFIEEQVERDR